MKQMVLLITGLCVGMATFAQSQIIIDLDQWKGKKLKVPFTVSSIVDQRSNPNSIGSIAISKTKEKEILFSSSSEVQFENFITKNFTQGNELDIRMEIERLDIGDIMVKKKKMQALYFACKFYKKDNSLSEPLYSFNARNTIPKKNTLKLAMTNYIGRAITSAILNFKKSYKKHPEWKKKNLNSPTVKMDKSVLYNQFAGGDTIGLNGNYKLTTGDFAGIVAEDEEDEAYSYIVMTYSLKATDEKSKIKLDISPKVYFLRSKSWSKKDSESNWMAHQQLLFDLASYHGLQFKKRLEEKEFSPGYYKLEVNKIYNDISKKYFNEMDQLQAETKYGENQEKESIWRAKIDTYLKKN
jgi:hypothetical protein